MAHILSREGVGLYTGRSDGVSVMRRRAPATCESTWHEARSHSLAEGSHYRAMMMLFAARDKCPQTLLNGNTFSGGPGLELVELEPCAEDHARKIGRQHHHIEAALHCARRKQRAGTMHDGLDAVLMRGLPDLVAGREMDRIWIVAARYEPQRER